MQFNFWERSRSLVDINIDFPCTVSRSGSLFRAYDGSTSIGLKRFPVYSNEQFEECDICGEEFPVSSLDRWWLVDGQQICSSCKVAKDGLEKTMTNVYRVVCRKDTGLWVTVLARTREQAICLVSEWIKDTGYKTDPVEKWTTIMLKENVNSGVVDFGYRYSGDEGVI